MKKQSASRSAFFNPRVLISFAFCAIGVFLALLAFALYPGGNVRAAQGPRHDQSDVQAQELAQAADESALDNNRATSGNERAPSTNFRFGRAVYLLTAAELAADGLQSGTAATSIRWTYATGGNAGSAPLTIYMENTADVTNLKSASWSNSISSMTVVHNATTELPSVRGPFDITLAGGAPFTYTGGGLYIAFDWGQYKGSLSKTAAVSCNTALANGLLGAQSSSSAPATLTASNFRPVTRLNAPAGGGVTVSLPIDNFDTSVPIATVIIRPVNTTQIDASLNYVGFQGDFTFNETVVTFPPPFVNPAGLTGGGNWNVTANVLPGPGPIRILRVSAFAQDFVPLDGSGVLYNLRMVRVSGTPGANTPLSWQPPKDNFLFIDGDLNTIAPAQINGSITITGSETPTPSPTQTPTPTSTATATATATSTATATATATPTATATATATATSPLVTPSATPTCPSVVTQSNSQAITASNSGSCNNGVGHSDNSYWRAFDMSSLGGAQYNVASVSFGVQSTITTQSVTVRLHTTANFPAGFPGSLTQIGTATLSVTAAQAGTVVTTPLVAVVPPGTSQLVMELFTPNAQATGNLFFVGSNAAGQTGPSYLSAVDCGLTVPTDTSTIGLANMHVVFNVNGSCQPQTPTPTATPQTPTPTPTPTITPTPGTPTPTPTPTPGTPTPTPNPGAQTVNLSTRMLVQTGNNVGIGGFIVTGTVQKQVIVRAIGPSLANFGVLNPLADPVLELHGPGGFVTVINDNWRSDQEQEIKDTGLAPTNNLEAAIVANLSPGNYTAIVRGNNDTTGVALVEVYDLDPEAASKLANISTRAFVSTGTDIMIAGFILGSGSEDTNMILRGIGPSLGAAGIANPLADPTLELRDGSGTLLVANDNWQDDQNQAAIISAAGLGLPNPLESGIAATLPPGNYTALLKGINNTTGVGLVEAYHLGNGPLPTPPPATPSPTPPPGTPSPTPSASPSASPGGECVEAFDTVTAPALPAGWTAANPIPGDGTMWVTTTDSSDSAPNNAFVPDQDDISDKVLDSRPINITSAGAVMSFRNNYITEYDPPPTEVFWDGYVLEVSIAGAEFLDVTDSHIGGSIVSGGYDGEIDGSAENPLAGRLAWCGESGGYINTVVNLGPNVAGQSIKLRFRMGTDQALGRPGVHIDGISITNANCPP